MLGIVLNAGKPLNETDLCQNFHSGRRGLLECLGFVTDLKGSEKTNFYILMLLFSPFWLEGGAFYSWTATEL